MLFGAKNKKEGPDSKLQQKYNRTTQSTKTVNPFSLFRYTI